ncbi:MAG: hypothetical protein GY851_31340 [bacterium]|nr:hypothetical protein [bacterium]
MSLAVCWVFIVSAGITGAIAVVHPAGLRRIIRVFMANGPVRLFGLGFMVLGSLTFRAAAGTGAPILMKTAGVFVFMYGGVQLALPSAAVVLNDRLAHASNWALRAVGLVYLAIAGLAFHILRTIPEAVETISNGTPGL